MDTVDWLIWYSHIKEGDTDTAVASIQWFISVSLVISYPARKLACMELSERSVDEVGPNLRHGWLRFTFI